MGFVFGRELLRMGTVTSGGRSRRVVEGEELFASLEMCMVELLVLLATEFYICFFGGGGETFECPLQNLHAHSVRFFLCIP